MGDTVTALTDEQSEIADQIVAALKGVYDPEIPVDIYELGLIYSCEIDDAGHLDIQMTLTAPACPVAGQMPGMVKSAVEEVPGVKSAEVELVWDPPWSPEMMSDAARLQLGFM